MAHTVYYGSGQTYGTKYLQTAMRFARKLRQTETRDPITIKRGGVHGTHIAVSWTRDDSGQWQNVPVVCLCFTRLCRERREAKIEEEYAARMKANLAAQPVTWPHSFEPSFTEDRCRLCSGVQAHPNHLAAGPVVSGR